MEPKYLIEHVFALKPGLIMSSRVTGDIEIEALDLYDGSGKYFYLNTSEIKHLISFLSAHIENQNLKGESK